MIRKEISEYYLLYYY